MPTIDLGQVSWHGNALDSEKLGGKAPEYYIQPRNLLDNSDFTNPVNQRNITSCDTTFTGYTIDRWIVQNTSSLFTLDSDGLNLAAETSFKYIYQRLNNVTVGKTYTLAACLSDGTIGTLTFTLTSTTNSFTWLKETKISDSLRIGVAHSASIPLFVALSNVNDATARIVWTALYEGEYTADTLPPYVPKGYAAELAECQRYYLRQPTGSAWNVLTVACHDYIVVKIPTPSTMRKTPSLVPHDNGMEIYVGGWNKIDETLFQPHLHNGEIVLQCKNSLITNVTLEAGMSYLINYPPSLSADL